MWIVVDGTDMDIRTLPTISHDSQRLAALHGEWRELCAAMASGHDVSSLAEVIADLAQQVIAHRAELFAANASIQGSGDASSQASAKLDANDEAIKFCTAILGEMNVALGRTSLPPPPPSL